MSQTNSYKVVREGSQFGKPGTLVPLTANQASAFERTGEIVFEKAGEPLPPKGAKADAALRARITQLETDLQAALAGAPDAAALKTAQDAQAEAERLLAAGKEAAALIESERDKALADLAAKEAELGTLRTEHEALRTELEETGASRELLAETLVGLGFTFDDQGNPIPPAAAPVEETAG